MTEAEAPPAAFPAGFSTVCFYGAASMTEAEGPHGPRSPEKTVGFNGAASMTEAEGSATDEQLRRALTQLQRGRLDDQGGGPAAEAEAAAARVASTGPPR